ncbi:putative aquaporin [Cyclospora cayetanensis]|uniref:Aquaporin n=1 Tax=Cyclospora cayetanensis TaxID=88456 RepID=A0A1D3DAB8_9EIME|nr:putative aquaporin [Cyclospora cayetanensis]
MDSQKQTIAEFVGTLLLVFSAGLLPLLKLECLDFAGALALSYGLLLLTMNGLEAKSLNPALTVADVLRGKLEAGAACVLILAQLAGAAIGGFLLSVFLHDSDIFPASTEIATTDQFIITQLAFSSALVFAYIRGAGASKYDGPWLAALMYGAFMIGGDATACLNPAVALGVSVSRGVSGAATNETWLALLILMPLLAAGAAYLLDKSAQHNLQLSELIGTFFLSFGIIAAALEGGLSAAVGLAFFSAAVVRMIAPASGGSLNCAVTGGALLIEGRGISKDAITIWLSQLAGAVLAAIAAAQALGSMPSDLFLLAGDWNMVAVSLGISALLMIAYCTKFGDFLGSPAVAFIGAVYGGSIAAAKNVVSINPSTALGAAIAWFVQTGEVPQPLETASAVFVPVIGCMAGAILLRFIPSEYRRRL